MISVLYVDNDPGLLGAVKAYLEKTGDISVDATSSPGQARKGTIPGNYDVIVSGYHLEDMDGIEFLKTVRAKCMIPFIFFTERGCEEVIIEAMNNGADYCQIKEGDIGLQFEGLAWKILASVRIPKNLHYFTEIIRILPIPAFILDSRHSIVSWNRALEDYTGFSADTMAGTSDHWKPFYDHQRPCLADLVLDRAIDGLYRLYNGKNPRVSTTSGAYEAMDFFPTIKGGTLLFFTAVPLRLADGTIIGSIETLQDISRIGESPRGSKKPRTYQ